MKKIDLKKMSGHRGLLQVIASDLKHYRGLLIWGTIALASGFSAVFLTHMNRELIAEREQVLQYRDSLDVEYRHLIIEQNALSEHSRIETIAARQLGMQRPTDAQEVLVPWR